MRITKNPEERRNELIDAAEELFLINGYNNTSVSHIVKRVSVAQGTFYYYFNSKEDIFVAIFERRSALVLKKMEEKIKEKDYNAIEKINYATKIYIDSKGFEDNQKLVEALHYDENANLHYKVIIQEIKSKLPLFVKLIKEGVLEGLFHTDYPEEVAELFLVECDFLLDPGVFGLNEEKMRFKAKALCHMLEKVLEVPKGSFEVSI